jgi:uncharacterized protein YcgI (DUF1989 family)
MDGKVLQDAVIAPNDNWSAVLTPRQTLRIVDLEGKQAVDFLCYNADDVADRYNAADTMKYNKNVYLGAGHGIYSVRRRWYRGRRPDGAPSGSSRRGVPRGLVPIDLCQARPR